jgi:hypothetical protein
MRMRHIMWPARFNSIFPNPETARFSKNVIEHKMCAFISFTTFSEIHLIKEELGEM